MAIFDIHKKRIVIIYIIYTDDRLYHYFSGYTRTKITLNILSFFLSAVIWSILRVKLMCGEVLIGLDLYGFIRFRVVKCKCSAKSAVSHKAS